MARVGGREAPWTVVHVVTLVLVFVVLAYACRGQWFFGDEWDFIAFRGFHDALWGIWRPHNEHWSTLPILWWRSTFALFGLRTYWPYLIGLFATHLVVVHAVWRLMRRAGVGAALATGVAVVLGLFGAGAENLTWAFQVGFVGSLAAGLLLLLLVDERGERRRVALVAVGAIASLMLSGISVVMIGAVGLAALLRWGWRKALAATAPAGGAYLVWLQLYGRVGLGGPTSTYRGGPDDVARYVWGGVSTTLGAPFRSDRIGEALLVALLVTLVVKGRAWSRRAPSLFALAAACPVMFAVISQGRGAIQDPGAGRYLYLTAAMLLPLIGFAAQQLVGDAAPRVVIALVACFALTVVGVDQLRESARLDRARELALKGQMLAAIDVAKTERIVSDRPDFAYAADVTLDAMRRLRANGDLPAYTPTVADVAQARLALQVATSRQRVAGPCREVDLRGANAAINGSGTEPVLVSITPSVSGDARLFVPYEANNAGPRLVALRAGTRTTIHSSFAGRLVVQLPAGTATVCGSAWTSP